VERSKQPTVKGTPTAVFVFEIHRTARWSRGDWWCARRATSITFPETFVGSSDSFDSSPDVSIDSYLVFGCCHHRHDRSDSLWGRNSFVSAWEDDFVLLVVAYRRLPSNSTGKTRLDAGIFRKVLYFLDVWVLLGLLLVEFAELWSLAVVQVWWWNCFRTFSNDFCSRNIENSTENENHFKLYCVYGFGSAVLAISVYFSPAYARSAKYGIESKMMIFTTLLSSGAGALVLNISSVMKVLKLLRMKDFKAVERFEAEKER
jgi:hypothetical protein